MQTDVNIFIQQGERLAVIEERLTHIAESLDEHIRKDEETQKEIDKKLDEILALKHKGMGAFWLAAGILGGLMTVFANNILTFMKGLFHG